MYIKILRNRTNKLFSNLIFADEKTFETHCKILFNFFNDEILIKSILFELKNLSIYTERWQEIQEGILNDKLNLPDNELELAALSLKFLEKYHTNYACLRYMSEKIGERHGLHSFHKIFTEYLQSYINYKLENGDFILYLLYKYKCQCEWFNNEELLEKYFNDTAHGEDLLTKDLRKFLFNNGIDYPFSEPNTPSGKPDLVFVNNNNPLALEVKLYGGKNNYGKSYIKKGFHQAINYANDYNKSYAYLFIFNLSDKLLEFNLKDNNEPTHININNKSIFIVVVNLTDNKKTASQIQKEIVQINEEYLINR